MRRDYRSSEQNALIIEIANKHGRDVACQRFGITGKQLGAIFRKGRIKEQDAMRKASALAANVEASA